VSAKEEISIKNKVQYVLEKKGWSKHNHKCHWPGCEMNVKPQFWGCSHHWFRLPVDLRSMIWASYHPGQEITKTPSERYLRVAEKVQVWIIATEAWATIAPLVYSGSLYNLGVSQSFHQLWRSELRSQ
jgi:hypothetical protein